MKKIAMMMSVFALVGNLALAADKPEDKGGKKGFEPTKEQREKMAESHEKMAECLKSDKAFEDCRGEMMKSCEEHMGKDGCPMMGHGHGKGKHHGMMKGKK